MNLLNREPTIHYHYIKIGHDQFWDRFLEIFPAFIVFTVLLLPLFLSFFYPILVACFIIIYDILWLFRAVKYSLHLLNGYRGLKKTMKENWQNECKKMLNPENYLKELREQKREIESCYLVIKVPLIRCLFVRSSKINDYKLIKEKIYNLKELINYNVQVLNYNDIYHIVILATYKESIDILKQSVRALKDTYSRQKLFFVLATEERDKKQAQKHAKTLEKEFKKDFGLFLHVSHPANLPGEVKGKGANITYAAKKVKEIIDDRKIPYEKVLITTLDADTCVHPEYFWKLTYEYIKTPDRTYCSFQPIPIYSNNIWDVPPPMTIVSVSCSFWQIIQSSRPHLLRNFSVHAQSLKTLVDTNFWSKKTVVEDGHQFWRTFMRYNGHHEVIPLFIPVYQDAVLGRTYSETIHNQYLQLRRWSWGVTDFPYVVKNFIQNRKIPVWQKFLETWRAFEAPFSLATAPLILTFVAWMPILLNPHFKKYDILAVNLPTVCGGLLSIAMIGLFVSVIVSTLLIPSPPTNYSYRRKNKVILALQWIFLPLISIFLSALPALDAQVKLARGHYMEIPGFFVVEKIRKNKG